MSAVALTVCFEDPFWVGILEITEGGETRATRIVFGGEPTDAELHEFLLRHGSALLAKAAANPPVPADARPSRPRVNPKRAAKLAAREAARAAEGRRGTASQEAVRLEYEQRKAQGTADARARKADRAERRRAAALAKKKARHRGH
ncbi:YjdF family protein [Actinoallomurus soli]|uniref:YjdF family protein n=1 Tax=Actinoallomurus soli TaxID=2952535 RepID=UPI0020930660|nr:YjdF family protein [Actinoallomurus soli]MCO5970009.1 YjdF family protein [Actinoallomurus soli]